MMEDEHPRLKMSPFMSCGALGEHGSQTRDEAALISDSQRKSDTEVEV